MKKASLIIMSILFISIFIHSAYANGDYQNEETQATGVQVDITVVSDGDINSSTVLDSGGDVNANIACLADGDCNYNVDGDIYVPEDTSKISINQYLSQHNSFVDSTDKGLTLPKLIDKLEENLNRYFSGKGMDKETARFFSDLDSIFVSHKEYQKAVDQINSLNQQVDELNARVALLEKAMDAQPDKAQLDREMALQMSKEKKTPVQTDDGSICDYERFGDTCFKLTAYKTTKPAKAIMPEEEPADYSNEEAPSTDFTEPFVEENATEIIDSEGMPQETNETAMPVNSTEEMPDNSTEVIPDNSTVEMPDNSTAEYINEESGLKGSWAMDIARDVLSFMPVNFTPAY